MKPKNWNDVLALWLLLAIPGFWLAHARGWLPGASPEVMGALIATWTLVVTYYFRKQPPTNGGS